MTPARASVEFHAIPPELVRFLIAVSDCVECPIRIRAAAQDLIGRTGPVAKLHAMRSVANLSEYFETMRLFEGLGPWAAARRCTEGRAWRKFSPPRVLAVVALHRAATRLAEVRHG